MDYSIYSIWWNWIMNMALNQLKALKWSSQEDTRGVLQHSCRMQTSSWLHHFCHQQPDHQGLGFQDSTWKTYKKTMKNHHF